MSDSIHIRINHDVIRKNLDLMIKHTNAKNICELIHGMITESSKASDMFLKLLLNEPLPKLPEINSVGHFEMNATWFTNKDTTIGSKFDDSGRLRCVVIDHRGHHNYGVITVQYPCIDSKGQETTATTSLELEQFIPDDFEQEF